MYVCTLYTDVSMYAYIRPAAYALKHTNTVTHTTARLKIQKKNENEKNKRCTCCWTSAKERERESKRGCTPQTVGLFVRPWNLST